MRRRRAAVRRRVPPTLDRVELAGPGARRPEPVRAGRARDRRASSARSSARPTRCVPMYLRQSDAELAWDRKDRLMVATARTRSIRSTCTSSPMRRRHLRAVLRIEAQVYPRPWTHVAVRQRARAALDAARTSSRSVGREVVGYAGLMMSLDRRARHDDRGRSRAGTATASARGCCSRSRARRSTAARPRSRSRSGCRTRGAQEHVPAVRVRPGRRAQGLLRRHRRGRARHVGATRSTEPAYAALLDALERTRARHDGRRAAEALVTLRSSASRRRATRPRPRSSTTAASCGRRSSRARPTCTRASAASCPRSRAARTSSSINDVIAQALVEAGIDARRDRRGRGRARPGPRRARCSSA